MSYASSAAAALAKVEALKERCKSLVKLALKEGAIEEVELQVC